MVPLIQRQLDFAENRLQSEYRVLENIGKGNFATVYKCQSNIDHQFYAVKQSKAPLKRKIEHTPARLEAEAHASLAAELCHPNLVRYYDSWIERNELFLAMEFCDWSLAPRKYEEFELKCVLRDIIAGLWFMHQKGFAHCDVKPGNILFSKQQMAYKLGDLGLAQKLMPNEGEDINEGDARYIAPEIFQAMNSSQRIDLSKCDIFSLGCSIYELVTQKELPKCGPDWEGIREKPISIDSFKDMPYSPEMLSIMIQMMNPNPNERPSAKDLLATRYLRTSEEGLLKFLQIQNQEEEKKTENSNLPRRKQTD